MIQMPSFPSRPFITDCPSAPYPISTAGKNGNRWTPINALLGGQVAVGDPTTINYGSVEVSAETILVGDGASASGTACAFSPVYGLPGTQTGYVHGRHNGYANLGWLDGHAKSMKVLVSTHHSPRTPLACLVNNTLGDIVKYPRQYNSSSETDYTLSPLDQYYYALQKPAP